jgi:hypothetical protein
MQTVGGSTCSTTAVKESPALIPTCQNRFRLSKPIKNKQVSDCGGCNLQDKADAYFAEHEQQSQTNDSGQPRDFKNLFIS